jgi:hypothetical protein
MNGGPTCVQQKVTAEQLVRIVVKSLQDHPQALHHERSDVIWVALQKAFPCPTPAPALSIDDIRRDLGYEVSPPPASSPKRPR